MEPNLLTLLSAWKRVGALLVLCIGHSTVSAVTELPLPASTFVEVGPADRRGAVYAVGIGWRLPWRWSTPLGPLEPRLEGLLARLTMDSPGGPNWHSLQVVLLPLIRRTWNSASAPVFVEVGIGVSYLEKDLRTTSKSMGTRWNFHDTVAVGVQLGAQRQHELSLRLVHESNAGIRKPNPGMNSVRVRWTAVF